MPKIIVETKVVGFLSNVQLWLEGQETNLSYDGNKTWKSTDQVTVNDGILSIMLHCQGFTGAKWEITINDTKSAKELYKEKGSIDETGHSLLVDGVKIS